MKIPKIISCLTIACLMLPTKFMAQATHQSTNIIPRPNHIKISGGRWSIKNPMIYTNLRDLGEKNALKSRLRNVLKRNVQWGKSNASIKCIITDRVGETEGYKLDVNASGILIKARTAQGLSHAVSTLGQLIDHNTLPYVSIQDAPAFAYRGLMLDVSRHFMKKEFILSLLDRMADYKINTFHWHLVDGGGWRIESKIYPRLTEKAAYRTDPNWDRWWGTKDKPFVTADAPNAYGGYYTQQDIREIVAHATKLHIQVIPEIEIPGHSNELHWAYPEIFCQGATETSIGEVCPANDFTYTFFENILKEVMTLFPSKYIHIGGDEADKEAWKKCERCKVLMQKQGYDDIKQLQSHIIRHFTAFLKTHGREAIGWDEILEGGLADDAIVMSWRGEEGGIKAAKMGHKVIMTPHDYAYIDQYQNNPSTEPYAIGGFNPIAKVYSYLPKSDKLTPEEAQHILGVQANLWTEYVGDERKAEYMIFPRVMAMAEVGWTNPENKDSQDFMRRAEYHTDRLIAQGINAYPLKGITPKVQVDQTEKNITVSLQPERQTAQIKYTMDGTTPTMDAQIYQQPIIVRDSARISAVAYRDGKPLSTPIGIDVDYHHAIGGIVQYADSCMYSSYYPAGGKKALTDGYPGGDSYGDGRWQGFCSPFDVTVTLPHITEVSTVSARFFHQPGAWIYLPGSMEVMASEDGKNWKSIGTQQTPEALAQEPKSIIRKYTIHTQTRAKYIRVKATNVQRKGSWLFTDEIIIY